MKALDEIIEPLSNKYNDAIQRIHTINNYMKIDNLSKVAKHITKNNNLNVVNQLNKYIFFKNNPKNLFEQIKELQAISKKQLKQRIYKKLIKLHDEESYSINEIINLLHKRLPEKFREPNSYHENLKKEVLALLQKKINKRVTHKITSCPLQEHRC